MVHASRTTSLNSRCSSNQVSRVPAAMAAGTTRWRTPCWWPLTMREGYVTFQMAKFGESTNEERAEDEPTRPIHVEVGRQPSVCPAVSRLRERAIETAEQRATEQPRATKRTPLRHKTARRAVTDSVCVHFCHSARRWAPFGAFGQHEPRRGKGARGRAGASCLSLRGAPEGCQSPHLSVASVLFFLAFALYSPPRKSGVAPGDFCPSYGELLAESEALPSVPRARGTQFSTRLH